MQLSHKAITEATSKLLFVQMQFASIASSALLLATSRKSPLLSFVLFSLGSMSHALLRSTMGWQMVLHVEGTSSASSSSAMEKGMMAARPARRVVTLMMEKGGRGELC